MTQELSSQLLTSWQVPNTQGAYTKVDALAGEHTIIVGANGAGKSSLGAWLDQQVSGVPVTRIIAHRKIWFQSAAPALTAASREGVGSNLQMWSKEPTSRYIDNSDEQRTNLVLFDVMSAINAHNAATAKMARQGVSIAEIDRDLGQAPIDRLNAVLTAAGLPVSLSADSSGTFRANNGANGATYPIFQMSDGEKSAVLLASAVLVAPQNGIVIIDEPERHLHRSISAGLIGAILDQRSDSHFIVVTHDLELAEVLHRMPGKAFSLRGATWSGETTVGWDLDELTSDSALTDAARKAILGGRRDVLFVEGAGSSVDAQLYKILLPGWTVQPSGGADEVCRNVAGLRGSAALHWINAHGLIDGDARNDEEKFSFASKSVSVLEVSEVENLYFLPECLEAAAGHQGASLGLEPADLLSTARSAGLTALTEPATLERLAKKLAVAELRRRALEHVPDSVDEQDTQIQITLPSPYPRLLERLRGLASAGDMEQLVALLPIRDTPFRNRVASALGFASVAHYESHVRVSLMQDPGLASVVRSKLGPISETVT
ncbi:AAA family ATPase [Frigoribacterium sp. PhB118]|uniref:AAA family ATPase n=1 Tax=Frigoribacterium sp. PhB118 TaxID=2485175 RepID=UPI000F46C8DC|nr:AAA family ATPase [Frigoribacterium sp. PhB118]ROS53895.1 ABC-type lipoprotein export system ATPase subunit [Frigoribacterium sp. PhB118]